MTATVIRLSDHRRQKVSEAEPTLTNPFFPVIYCAHFWEALMGKRLSEYGPVGSGEVIEFPPDGDAA